MLNDYKIYVPDTTNYQCFVVRDSNTIRAYEEIPTNNSTIDYRDYYFKSNYLYQDGVQTFSQYTTIPVCLDNNLITDNFYYRNDFADILIIFLVLIGVPLLIVTKLIKIFFLGRKLY